MSTTAAPCLVTGATGLVGSRICLDLLLAGRKVRALRRAQSDWSILHRTFAQYSSLLEEIDWFIGDVTEVLSVYEALDGIEEVYHAAGLVSFDPKDRLRLYSTNSQGTTNMVNMSLERGVKRFCHISSVAAIGRSEQDAVIDESVAWTNSSFNTEYAISKYEAEREVWRGIEEGLQAVIVNPSIILGPGDWEKGSGLLFRAVWNGLRFYPSGTTGFVDVRDVSLAAITLVEKREFGKRFILNSDSIPYRTVFTEIANALGKPPVSIRVSKMLSNFAWRFEKLRCMITGASPVLTRETAHTSMGVWNYSGERLTKTTGIRCIPISQSIADWAVVFLKEHSQR